MKDEFNIWIAIRKDVLLSAFLIMVGIGMINVVTIQSDVWGGVLFFIAGVLFGVSGIIGLVKAIIKEKR